jgi:hypothetical protein
MTAERTGVVRIFNDTNPESTQTSWDLNDAKEYAKQWIVYEQQIKDIQESRKEWSSDFLEKKNIPKKELAQAIRAIKQELDMDVVHEIYDTISPVFGD